MVVNIDIVNVAQILASIFFTFNIYKDTNVFSTIFCYLDSVKDYDVQGMVNYYHILDIKEPTNLVVMVVLQGIHNKTIIDRIEVFIEVDLVKQEDHYNDMVIVRLDRLRATISCSLQKGS